MANAPEEISGVSICIIRLSLVDEKAILSIMKVVKQQ